MFKILVLLLTVSSCAVAPIKMNSDLDTILNKKMGVLLTVNLNTNGKVRRGTSCSISLKSGDFEYKVPLREGSVHYGVSLPLGSYYLSKLDCGIFYFYKLKKEHEIRYSPDEWTYWGAINFKLEDKKVLEWGNTTKSKDKLYEILEELNITRDEIRITPIVKAK